MKLFKAMLCSVAALSLLLPAAHAQAAPTVVKIALTQPTGHPTTDLIRGQFKKAIEEKTNGRFRIDVFDNYSFGNFEAVVQGLQFGMLQFAQESPSNLSIYDPKLMIFDLPYLMPDYDAVNILLDGKVGKELSRSLEKIGIKGMGWIALGTRFYWMNKPFHTMAEAKSMKIRATASKVHISMTKAFGMNPTPMAWSETFTALQQGTIEGQENPPSTLLANGWYEVQDYLAMTNHQIAMNFVLFNEDFYNSMSAEDQAVVDEACEAFVQKQLELFLQAMVDDVETLQEYGLEVTYPDREEMKAAGSGVIDEYREEYPEFDDIMTKIEALQEEYRASAGTADDAAGTADTAETAETAEAAA